MSVSSGSTCQAWRSQRAFRSDSRKDRPMRTRIQTLFVAAALLGAGAAPARGQNTAVDSRWLAYLGCWESIESAKSLVCLVPAAGGGTWGVDLVTSTKGQGGTRERVTPSGERVGARPADGTGS